MTVAKKKEIQTVEIIVEDAAFNFSVVDTKNYDGEIVYTVRLSVK